MKKLIGLLLLFIFCLTPAIKATTVLSSMTDETKEIDLSGKISTNKQRSLIKPVEAFIGGESIKVNFNASLENVIIAIYDEGGNIIYQRIENTYSGLNIIIDISSYEEGEYTITFTNPQGLYLYGNFVIQE